VVERRIELLVSDEELERRRAAWSYTPPPVDGYLARYARDAKSADQGGILE
jgi:dihydroxy-acid dehydratase